jgi:sulfur carrier protein ThiS
MRVTVEHEGEELHFESDAPVTINEILGDLGIAPSTVLAVHEGAIVPHTSKIKSDLSLELVVVSSGG